MASVRHLPYLNLGSALAPYSKGLICNLSSQAFKAKTRDTQPKRPTPVVHLKDAKFGGTAARDCQFLLFPYLA